LNSVKSSDPIPSLFVIRPICGYNLTNCTLSVEGEKSVYNPVTGTWQWEFADLDYGVESFSQNTSYSVPGKWRNVTVIFSGKRNAAERYTGTITISLPDHGSYDLPLLLDIPISQPGDY
jgi:hypothetical protein